MIDEVDLQILRCLIDQADRPLKEIGQQVHLTGQAVGARIRKLQDLGIIEGYTVRWSPDKIGLSVLAFITIFMKSNTAHPAFHTYVQTKQEIMEVHRVSGEGCYLLHVRVRTPSDLNELLDELLQYGNYKVSLSMGQVK